MTTKHLYDFILVSRNESTQFKKRIETYHEYVTKFLVLDTTGDFYTANWDIIKKYTKQIIPIHLSSTSKSMSKSESLNEGLKKGVREILDEIQEDDLIMISDVADVSPIEAITYLLEPENTITSARSINVGENIKAIVTTIADLIKHQQPSDIFKQRLIPLDYESKTEQEPDKPKAPESKEESNESVIVPNYPEIVNIPTRTLAEIFLANTGRGCSKVTNYFRVYERHLRPYLKKNPVILEIGVSGGGSLDMWNKYFGTECQIWGVDVNEQCRKFEKDNIHILIGDQENLDFLNHIKEKVPCPDIIIDDGGHHAAQQVNSFEVLFPHLKVGGIYVCEDIHTAYFKKYEGGLRRSGTMIEKMKEMVDQMNAWSTLSPTYEARSKSEEFQINGLTRMLGAIHFYPSIVVVEKEESSEPQQIKSGMEFLWGNRDTNELIVKRIE